MLTREELADLQDPGYRESLRMSFVELGRFLRENPAEPMDIDTLIDWLTFMSEFSQDRRPREFHTLPGRMLL